ncbi:hypothetical protein Ddc_12128 [Ditylenchus destructor]|nr:hypothetical protein Ddc_12128 [Ditylenchus destructor]
MENVVQELINDKTIGGLQPGDIVEEGIFFLGPILFFVKCFLLMTDDGDLDTQGGLALYRHITNEIDNPYKNFETKSRIRKQDLSRVTGKSFRLNNRAMSLLRSNKPEDSLSRAEKEVDPDTPKRFDLKHSCEHAVNAFVFNRYHSFILDADEKYRKAIRSNDLKRYTLRIELISADGNFTDGQVPYIDVMDLAGNSLACDAVTKSFRQNNKISNTYLDIFYDYLKKNLPKKVEEGVIDNLEHLEDINEKMAHPDAFVARKSETSAKYKLKATIRTWKTAPLWITVGKDRESKLTSYLVHVNDYIDGVKTTDKKKPKGMRLTVGSDNPPEVKYVKWK